MTKSHDHKNEAAHKNGCGHEHGHAHAHGHLHEHEKAADALGMLKIDICIISDSRTPATDETGKWLKENIDAADKVETGEYALIKNDAAAIKKVLDSFLKGGAHALVMSGGTGLSSKDITIETVSPLFEKTLSGFGEIFRLLSFEEIGARAIMSRAAAGVIASKLVISLPGSKNAVRLAYDKIIKPQLHHLIYEATR
jgi:molybdenum cofactor biosynthesis protein B